MNKDATILITGVAGFIASCMASYLNELGFEKLYFVDDFSRKDKLKNYQNLKFISLIDRNALDTFLLQKHKIDFIIHFGARTDTTEMDYSIHEKLNVEASKIIWKYCTLNQIPLIYASSAATYGKGEFGYDDNHEIINQLKPLNPYGVSKNEFDKWAILQNEKPPNWYGLKFFNVYGPNEYHKGRMASVIFHAYHQIKKTGKLKLFKSHHKDYADGGQLRDFVYVKDVIEVTLWLMNHLPKNGIYNLGTGKAHTFNDLALAIFSTMNMSTNIEYIDTPFDIRDKYQYFTEANMSKLISAGYLNQFKNIQDGVEDYIINHLEQQN